jgi:glutamine synthetase
VRVPSAPRFEYRLGDMSANPYLLQASPAHGGTRRRHFYDAFGLIWL